MGNFTENGHYTNELNGTSTLIWPKEMIALFSALNILLSITASLANVLILVALHKDTSLHPTTKLLFRCLAVTDLSVGLITQPNFAVTLVSYIAKLNFIHIYAEKVNGAFSFSLCMISILASSAISVDRLLALLLGLRYRHVITLTRVRRVVTCIWVIGVSCGVMHLWSFLVAWIPFNVVGVLSVITSIVSYTTIYLKLCQQQARAQERINQGQRNRGGIPQNIARYRKTVSTIAWVQLVLLSSYLPYFIVSVLSLTVMSNRELIELLFLATLTQIYFNSTLNPILYCWKIREVRRVAKYTIRQICC